MSEEERVVAGIDPGQNGCVAVVYLPDKAVATAPLLFEDEDRKLLAVAALYDFVRQAVVKIADGRPITVVLEKVQGDPKFGGGRAFTFGSGYGQVLAVLKLALRDEIASRQVKFLSPPPRSWQNKLFDKLPDGLSAYFRKKALKQRSIERAKADYRTVSLRLPDDKADNDNLADALNLATYGILAA